MRLLVTGASGLLGGELARRLAERHAVVAAAHGAAVPAGLETTPLELVSPASIEGALARSRAEAVLHAAALADVDACEADPERALAVNVMASERLARACARAGLPLVLLSTDLVLPGDRPASDETARPAPLMGYGRGKRLAEEAVLGSGPLARVARVALVYGRGHGARATASESVAWALAAGRRVRLFTDQYRSPVDAASLTGPLERLLAGAGSGLYHLGGPERLSRFELGRRVALALGLPHEGLEPVRYEVAPPAGAQRPADVSLDSSRAAHELGFRPVSVAAAIRAGRPAPFTGQRERPRQ